MKDRGEEKGGRKRVNVCMEGKVTFGVYRLGGKSCKKSHQMQYNAEFSQN